MSPSSSEIKTPSPPRPNIPSTTLNEKSGNEKLPSKVDQVISTANSASAPKPANNINNNNKNNNNNNNNNKYTNESNRRSGKNDFRSILPVPSLPLFNKDSKMDNAAFQHKLQLFLIQQQQQLQQLQQQLLQSNLPSTLPPLNNYSNTNIPTINNNNNNNNNQRSTPIDINDSTYNTYNSNALLSLLGKRKKPIIDFSQI